MGSLAITIYYGLVPLTVIALSWRAIRRAYTRPEEGEQ